ncbi:hypothetical protein C8R43DRAFT_960962 [Mycena crocata]|nr:hypothetical protein C8R43DRAFT_960962 [Mycena crocata]
MSHPAHSQNPGDPTSPGYTTKRRGYIACIHCRKAKVKCLTNEECSEPCERCVRKGLGCEYRTVDEPETDVPAMSPGFNQPQSFQPVHLMPNAWTHAGAHGVHSGKKPNPSGARSHKQSYVPYAPAPGGSQYSPAMDNSSQYPNQYPLSILQPPAPQRSVTGMPVQPPGYHGAAFQGYYPGYSQHPPTSRAYSGPQQPNTYTGHAFILVQQMCIAQ